MVQLQKKAKVRQEEASFVIEGSRICREAPVDWIRQIYVSESFEKNRENQDFLEGKKYEVLSDSVFSYVSDTKTPQGILCIMAMPKYSLDDLVKNPDGLYLILENVQDPGNVGTMFRTGEGAGVSGIIMSSDTADIFNPKTIRSTMGSIFRMPFYITSDLQGTIRKLRQMKIQTYGAHLKGSVSYEKPDYTKGTAFLIGNEGNGLTDGTADAADACVHIPMHGHLESLNAAMSAGILMYEADRQRRNC